MEANLLGAPPTAALRQPAYGKGDQQQGVDVPQHGGQETEPESFRPISRPIQRAGSLLLVAGVAVAQVVWVALLAYGVYWVGTHLPV
jgi:hypothetical protein